ncbi:MAG: carboxypeptidase-like regulatory domain-containing protein [Bacteroidota bacterium]|nr:carboxypeptidase-like regulatory domain-containing protein [Bacteroidota bacterium]
MRFLLLLICMLCINLIGIAQVITGKITDTKGKLLEQVNVSVVGESGGSISNKIGEYKLSLKTNRSIVIGFSSVGFSTEKVRIPILRKGEHYVLNIVLESSNTILKDVIVKDKAQRKDGLTRIKVKHVNILPSSTGGIEGILKTLPGVSSVNELSSQYSVRGGNFDENLIYVNGTEIYRTFLIHTGKQEGLSFINPDLIDNIKFSAGGFEAKYGDKMSSVLDITYKKPKKHLNGINMSLLGGSAYTQGITKNKRLSYLLGIRHKTNKYLFNAMDTKADYTPNAIDLQTYITYKLNPKWEFNFLGNMSYNKYQMIPKNRDTQFGSINEALSVRMFFEGQEIDQYQTFFSAFTTNYKPNDYTNLEFTTSATQTFEEENFDILAEYWLYQLENNLGSSDFGDVKFERGVGKYIDHARNKLDAQILNVSHKGTIIQKKINQKLEWGMQIQKEKIQDEISEWNLIDSAGFTLPHPYDSIGGVSNPNQQIIMNELLKTNLAIESYRNSGYIQFTKDINNLTINSGIRGSYWSFNEEFLLSPRASLAYAPLWKKDVIFRIASGVYYQSPFYRELRTLEGKLNHNTTSPKSIHFVLGTDYLFYAWGRPFKWTTELYYKNLKNLIPYKIENLRIQYLANTQSNGYATGIDIKINGEFVPGMESWASLSFMRTEEDIVGDSYINKNTGEIVEPGYIPRPTDQRINFSMFFQDYIPGYPDYKMHLNLLYGTGLPFGPPKSEKYEDILRFPSYKRVDIGFSAILKDEQDEGNIKWLNSFKSIWASIEVFNLLNIDNTISYLWVADVSGREYAVPNYLTSRQLNFKLNLAF